MAEEFQESEVMFHLELPQDTEKHVDKKYAGRGELGEIFELDGATLKSEGVFPAPLSSTSESRNDYPKSSKRKKNTTISVPVNISIDMEVSDEDYGEFVPPHVIIGHRVAGQMIPFSVRTLKGRDLSDLRNSILRMTGFLET